MLQKYTAESFPLQKYIINVEKTIDRPAYLDPGKLYDLSDLSCQLFTLPELPQSNLGSKRDDWELQNSLANLPKPTYNARKANQCKIVSILSDNWPDSKLLGFDESQLAAFKAAITQQLAIIQGPPGNSFIYYLS